LSGLGSIRAYTQQKSYISKNLELTDYFTNPTYHIIVSQQWLSLRLEILGTLLITITSCIILLMGNTISPGLAGLSLSNLFSITQLLSNCIKQATETVNLKKKFKIFI
jgi:ATP-binding cassette, subfamily C (CFTR/MRP), member 1